MILIYARIEKQSDLLGLFESIDSCNKLFMEPFVFVCCDSKKAIPLEISYTEECQQMKLRAQVVSFGDINLDLPSLLYSILKCKRWIPNPDSLVLLKSGFRLVSFNRKDLESIVIRTTETGLETEISFLYGVLLSSNLFQAYIEQGEFEQHFFSEASFHKSWNEFVRMKNGKIPVAKQNIILHCSHDQTDEIESCGKSDEK